MRISYWSSDVCSSDLLMRKMSPELRGLCARHMGEQWMNDVPFLKSMSTPLIAELFVTFRLQTFIPREQIFTADDLADRMIILRRGSVFVRGRTDERRVEQEFGGTCSYRWSTYN